jgi:DNA-3-methyladenine glycosylase I
MNCALPNNDLLMSQYHDFEWSLPLCNDEKHFQFLISHSIRTGLSRKNINDYLICHKHFTNFKK